MHVDSSMDLCTGAATGSHAHGQLQGIVLVGWSWQLRTRMVAVEGATHVGCVIFLGGVGEGWGPGGRGKKGEDYHPLPPPPFFGQKSKIFWMFAISS